MSNTLKTDLENLVALANKACIAMENHVNVLHDAVLDEVVAPSGYPVPDLKTNQLNSARVLNISLQEARDTIHRVNTALSEAGI